MRHNTMRGNVYGLGPRQLARILSYIDDNLHDTLDYGALCQIAALSRSRLGVAFKVSMGITPHRYIVARRIEKVKALLRDTEIPAAEIAISVGFSSQSHMSSCFRKLTGTTPSQYRRHGDQTCL